MRDRTSSSLWAALLAAALTACSTSAGASSTGSPGPEHSARSHSGEVQSPPEWRNHPHHVSIVVGGSLAEDEEHAATVGIDFEYRVSGFLGVGGVFEHAGHPIEATTLLATADLHLWRGLALQTGPGAIITSEETSFAYRFGLLYEFELGDRWTLSPQLHYDLQQGHPDEFVYLLALGVTF